MNISEEQKRFPIELMDTHTYNPLLLGNWFHGRMKNLEMQHTFRNFEFLFFL